MSESDPTDHALATIASILDQPASPPEAAKAVAGEKPEDPAHQATGIDGYSKSGPGPMEAIRFKWSVRRRREARITKTMTINQANGGRRYLFSGRYLTKLSLNRTTISAGNERYRQRCRLFGDHAID